MIQIAIMGLGTVGTGVAKVVAENARQIEHKLGEPLQVKAILVRHFKDGPYRQLMTDDFRKIEEDDDIRVVVETIGGVGAAYEYTKRALMAGKHVVTANKQLVAEHGCELLALANEELWVGHFSYWTEQNMPVFKHSVIINDDEEMVENKVSQIIDIAIRECERMYPIFNVVLTRGMDPRQALYPMMMETKGSA